MDITKLQQNADQYAGKEVHDTEKVLGTAEYKDIPDQRIHSRFFCATCYPASGSRKKPVHCYIKNNELQDTCSNKKCQCPCRKKYECQYGILHNFNQVCSCKEKDTKKYSKDSDEQWLELLDVARKYYEDQDAKNQVYKDITSEQYLELIKSRKEG